MCVPGPPDTRHSPSQSGEWDPTTGGFSLVQALPVFWVCWSWCRQDIRQKTYKLYIFKKTILLFSQNVILPNVNIFSYKQRHFWMLVPQHFVGMMGQQSYHARWVNWESTEQATTWVLIAWNSCTRSLNAMISVGQTNVLQNTRQHALKTCTFCGVMTATVLGGFQTSLTSPGDKRKRQHISLWNPTASAPWIHRWWQLFLPSWVLALKLK